MTALSPSVTSLFGGLKVFYTTNALKETDERLFPLSKNRSARILKKLIKRHGGEFRKVPTIYKTANAVYTHPALRHEFEFAMNTPRRFG